MYKTLPHNMSLLGGLKSVATQVVIPGAAKALGAGVAGAAGSIIDLIGNEENHRVGLKNAEAIHGLVQKLNTGSAMIAGTMPMTEDIAKLAEMSKGDVVAHASAAMNAVQDRFQDFIVELQQVDEDGVDVGKARAEAGAEAVEAIGHSGIAMSMMKNRHIFAKGSDEKRNQYNALTNPGAAKKLAVLFSNFLGKIDTSVCNQDDREVFPLGAEVFPQAWKDAPCDVAALQSYADSAGANKTIRFTATSNVTEMSDVKPGDTSIDAMSRRGYNRSGVISWAATDSSPAGTCESKMLVIVPTPVNATRTGVSSLTYDTVIRVGVRAVTQALTDLPAVESKISGIVLCCVLNKAPQDAENAFATATAPLDLELCGYKPWEANYEMSRAHDNDAGAPLWEEINFFGQVTGGIQNRTLSTNKTPVYIVLMNPKGTFDSNAGTTYYFDGPLADGNTMESISNGSYMGFTSGSLPVGPPLTFTVTQQLDPTKSGKVSGRLWDVDRYRWVEIETIAKELGGWTIDPTISATSSAGSTTPIQPGTLSSVLRNLAPGAEVWEAFATYATRALGVEIEEDFYKWFNNPEIPDGMGSTAYVRKLLSLVLNNPGFYTQARGAKI
jgi:hypothetical protein